MRFIQKKDWSQIKMEKKMAYTTVSELSIADFKNLIRETVNETITEFFSDPDEGLVLREEVAEYIHASHVGQPEMSKACI